MDPTSKNRTKKNCHMITKKQTIIDNEQVRNKSNKNSKLFPAFFIKGQSSKVS